MKRYIFPEDIKFISTCGVNLDFDSKEEMKKAIDFLNEVECNFNVRYNPGYCLCTIKLKDAELVPTYLYSSSDGDDWDFLTLIIE